MQIGIHGKEVKGQQVKFVEDFLETLISKKVEVRVSSKFLKYLKSPRISQLKIKSFDLGDNLNRLDAFISLGGGGTLLDSITYLGKNETPIMGINTGRMGFLSTISRDETEQAIHHLLNGTVQTGRRARAQRSRDQRGTGHLREKRWCDGLLTAGLDHHGLSLWADFPGRHTFDKAAPLAAFPYPAAMYPAGMYPAAMAKF